MVFLRQGLMEPFSAIRRDVHTGVPTMRTGTPTATASASAGTVPSAMPTRSSVCATLKAAARATGA